MAQGHKCVTVNATGCGFDSEEIFLFLRSSLAVLSSATRHAMFSDFGGKWGTFLNSFLVTSAYHAVCGIQCEADSFFLYIYLRQRSSQTSKVVKNFVAQAQVWDSKRNDCGFDFYSLKCNI